MAQAAFFLAIALIFQFSEQYNGKTYQWLDY
jgi:hypothetical protein